MADLYFRLGSTGVTKVFAQRIHYIRIHYTGKLHTLRIFFAILVNPSFILDKNHTPHWNICCSVNARLV